MAACSCGKHVVKRGLVHFPFLQEEATKAKNVYLQEMGSARVWLAVAPLGQWAWSGLAGRVLRLGEIRESAWIGVLVFLPDSWNCQEAQDGDWRWTGMRSGALCWAHCSVCVCVWGVVSRLLASGWSSHLPGHQKGGRLLRAGNGNEIPVRRGQEQVSHGDVKQVSAGNKGLRQTASPVPSSRSPCVHALSCGRLNKPGGLASYRKRCVPRSA